MEIVFCGVLNLSVLLMSLLSNCVINFGVLLIFNGFLLSDKVNRFLL